MMQLRSNDVVVVGKVFYGDVAAQAMHDYVHFALKSKGYTLSL